MQIETIRKFKKNNNTGLFALSNQLPSFPKQKNCSSVCVCVSLQLSFPGAAWPSSEYQNAPLSHLYFSILRVFCNNLNFPNMQRHHSALYSLVKFHQGAGVTRGPDSLKCYTCCACSSHLLQRWSTFIFTRTQLGSCSFSEFVTARSTERLSVSHFPDFDPE